MTQDDDLLADAECRVDARTRPGVLMLVLIGAPSAEQMQIFLQRHNDAIRGFNGAPYRVFCDLRFMMPMSYEATEYFLRAKSFSSAQSNFQGSAVLVASAVVAMQHRRTSLAGGVMDTELISDDQAACWAHLASVQR